MKELSAVTHVQVDGFDSLTLRFWNGVLRCLVEGPSQCSRCPQSGN